MERENLSSRLGFILISAGCAIGLGNVWRFPFITGMYGGAAFVLIYLFFLLILGLPIMVAEFSVGRASARSAAMSFDVLEPKGTKWHLYKYGAIAGNYLLMMFYTTVAGWMLYYFYKMATGAFIGLDTKGIGALFGGLLGDPLTMTFNMVLTVVICFGVCLLGLQAGVEKITKLMMGCLLVLIVALAANSLFLPGAEAGLKYYLYPDFSKTLEKGLSEVIFAAMGQAFFTLSLGHRRAGYLRQLYRQRTFPHRRSYFYHYFRHGCRPHLRPNHFSGLFQFWRAARQRPKSAVRHPAQCF